MRAKGMSIREMITIMAETPAGEIVGMPTEHRNGGVPVADDATGYAAHIVDQNKIKHVDALHRGVRVRARK